MNLPNKLTLLRIILVPVFMVVLYWGFPGATWVALAIFIIASLTDMLDGKIARHFNMITDWGKLIDPVADKFTFAAIALSMSFRYPLMGVVFGLYVVKELYMLGMGAVMLRRGFRMDGAQWYGKVCTAVTYAVVFLLLAIPGMPEQVSDALIGICLAATVFAFVGYVAFYARAWRSLSK